MRKELYIYRNIKTNEIENIMLCDIWTDIDEERTWFYYEWLVEENNIPDNLKKFI